MHELSTIYYVIDTVENLMKEKALQQVGSITLQVGEVSAIVPEYLESFWEYASKKTERFQNTSLKIESIPAITYCEECRGTYSTIPHGKTCPYCGSGRTFLIRGNEYMIKEIEAI